MLKSKLNTRQTSKDLLLILIGGLIFAIGINFFTIPNYLSEGGILGVTVVLHYLFDWSQALVNLILNFILLIIGYKFFESRVMYYTIFSVITSSFFLYITEDIGKSLTEDTLLAAIFAGLFVGIGLGLIFRAGGTNGGATVLVRIANQYLGMTMGNAMLLMDIIVVAGSVFIIGIDKGMYTLISVFVGAKVIDYFVDRIDERIAVFIMSDQAEEIKNRVIHQMSRGITVLDGHGGYSGDNKKILYIVVSRKELVPMKKFINEIDKEAYVTVHNVQEMIRKGYKANLSA